ncbi:MAG: MAPEG family protein [Actinomycetota bacterium]|nr:MAPEG family protein [Actinomycetota bacterium]
MHWVALITVLALVEYLVFQGATGAARQKAKIPAPKVTGDEHYERWYRVQMNTVEQLVVFLPALWLCAHVGATTVALVAGSAFLVGRALYAMSYVKDPEKRTIGFVLGYLANVVLIVRAGWSAIMSVVM